MSIILVLIFIITGCENTLNKSSAIKEQNPDPNQSSKYLNAVRQFADNVLKYGRDDVWNFWKPGSEIEGNSGGVSK